MDDLIKAKLAFAQEVHSQGQFEQAGAAYEEIVGQDPGCGDAWYGLGTLALQIGDPTSAIDLLNKAIECNSTVSAYFTNLGEAYRRAYQVEAAVAVLRVACELAPSNPDPWINLGVALGEQGDFSNAEDALKQACAVHPENFHAYKNLGVVKQKQGALAEAEANYRIAISLNPGDVRTMCSLGETLSSDDKHGEAVDVYRRALHLDPYDIDAQIGMSTALFFSGQKEQAEALLDEIVSLNPNNAQALTVRGQFHLTQGNYSEAIPFLDSAIRIDPLQATPLRLLSSIYEKQQDYEKASELIFRALSLHPRDCSIMRKLADIYRGRGETLAAIAVLKQTITLEPNDPETHYQLGLLLGEEDRLKEGEAALRKAVELKPDDPNYGCALGWMLYRLDRMEDALAAFDDAEAYSPNSAAITSNRGAVMFDCGRFDEALALYESVLRSNPNDLAAHGNKALVLASMGKPAVAKQHIETALTLAGEDHPRIGSLHFNLSTIEFQLGNLQRAWDLYRFRQSAVPSEHLKCPVWQGEDLAGKRIYIWQDQGIGDQIMFGCMYQEIIDHAKEVVIDCHPKILPLLRRTFPGAVFIPRILPPHPLMLKEFDYHTSSGDLGRWLRPALSSFSRKKSGFLKVDKARSRYWRQTLNELSQKPKIGISWRSKLQTTRRSQQYTNLEEWESILRLDQFTFINLQYDKCSDELSLIKERYGIDIVDFPYLNQLDDIDETAAMMTELDLVISAPTCVAATAAGLGVRTWGVLADYTWTFFGTSYQPLMPAIEKNFAKAWDTPWRHYLDRIAQELEASSATFLRKP